MRPLGEKQPALAFYPPERFGARAVVQGSAAAAQLSGVALTVDWSLASTM